MQLITLARILIWSVCVGGAIVFLIGYEPAQKFILSNAVQFGMPEITAENLKNLAESTKSATVIWDGVSALFVAVGALIHREHYKVNKNLNGDWYWVSTMEHEGKLVRAGWGEMIIHSIHDAKLRKTSPQEVIRGQAFAASDSSSAEGSLFQATEIVIGRASSRVLFFEWEYHDGFSATGVTKLTYFTKPEAPGWFSGESPIGMRGAFMMDTSEGSGKIQFFEKREEANKKYTDELTKILGVPQGKAA
jgi:hypothetical protein